MTNEYTLIMKSGRRVKVFGTSADMKHVWDNKWLELLEEAESSDVIDLSKKNL